MIDEGVLLAGLTTILGESDAAALVARFVRETAEKAAATKATTTAKRPTIKLVTKYQVNRPGTTTEPAEGVLSEARQAAAKMADARRPTILDVLSTKCTKVAGDRAELIEATCPTCGYKVAGFRPLPGVRVTGVPMDVVAGLQKGVKLQWLGRQQRLACPECDPLLEA